MKSRAFKRFQGFALTLAMCLLAACQAGSAKTAPASSQDKKQDGWGTGVVGYNHLGKGHHVGEIYLNGQACGGAGNPHEYSSSTLMCSMWLVRGWTPDFKAHLKWWVGNWNAELTGLQKDNEGQWYEADVAVEPYTNITYGTSVHFFPNGVARIVPNIYGPPESDTRPDQTPALTELPVYPPPWEGIGYIEAAKTHEGKFTAKDQADLTKYLAAEKAYLAFMERLWAQRGYSEEQKQKAMAEIQEKKRLEVIGGYTSYLINLAFDANLSRAERRDLIKGQADLNKDDMNQRIADFMASHGKQSLWSKP